jgi:hypothetical protein
MMLNPPTVSMMPAMPSRLVGSNGGADGLGGYPNTFIVPAEKNTRPATTRSTLSIRPFQGDRVGSKMDMGRLLVALPCVTDGPGRRRTAEMRTPGAARKRGRLWSP